jgi:hypothetical protein
MKKPTFLKIVGSLVMMLFISSMAYAKEENSKPAPFRIKLNVSASENTKKELEKCLGHEIAAYGDIILVDNDAEYELSITAIEKPVKGMPKPDIILSVITSQPFSNDIADIDKILSNMNPFQESYMRNFFSRSRILLDHQLKFVEPDKLTNMCKNIVVNFDNKYLAKSRKLLHRSMDKTKNQNTKKE